MARMLMGPASIVLYRLWSIILDLLEDSSVVFQCVTGLPLYYQHRFGSAADSHDAITQAHEIFYQRWDIKRLKASTSFDHPELCRAVDQVCSSSISIQAFMHGNSTNSQDQGIACGSSRVSNRFIDSRDRLRPEP